MLSPEVLLPLACARQLRRRGNHVAARLGFHEKTFARYIHLQENTVTLYIRGENGRHTNLKKIEIGKQIGQKRCRYDVYCYFTEYYKQLQGNAYTL